MPNLTPTNDLLLEGTLETKLLGQATPQGWRPLLGSAKVSLAHKPELIEVPSTDRGSFGAVVATASKPKPSELKVTLSRTTGISLAMGLMGWQASYTQSAGSATDQAITALLGQGVDMVDATAGHVTYLDLDTVVVKNSAGTTTYDRGTDYEVNERLGTLYALEGGAIADGQELKWSGDWLAVAGLKIDGAQVSKWNVALRLDGKNQFDNQDVVLEIDEAVLVSDGEIDFKSDKPINVGFSGRLVSQPGKPPFRLRHGIGVTG